MPTDTPISRAKLVELLNGDLAREYQAIIAYVNNSQVLDLATALGEDVPDVSEPALETTDARK